MAIINTIRKRTALLLGIMVLVLLAFIFEGLLTNSSLLGGGIKPVGEIAGNDISLEEFQAELSIIEAQYEMSTGGQPIDEATQVRLRQQAWDRLVFKYAYAEEYEALGIMVTTQGADAEIIDMVQGLTLHQQMLQEQSFRDPSTGQFSPELVQRFLGIIAEPADREAEYYRKIWIQREQGMYEERLRSKYFNLYSKTAYVTELEAQREHIDGGSTAVIDYFYLPFSAIEDSVVAVSEAEMKAYLKAHPNEFEAYPNRAVDYVVFNVEPSAADYEAFMISMRGRAERFAEAENDTAFINSFAENPFIQAFPKEMLPPAILADSSAQVEVGKVYGPLMEGGPGKFKVYKVLGRVEDTILAAQHILLTDPVRADSALAALKAGANFEELAKAISEDPGSGAKGGDLGEFSSGQMVGEFEGGVRSAKRAGVLDSLVQSQFGYHIIKVDAPGGVKRTEPKIVVGAIDRTLIASEATRNKVYKQASIFQNRSKEGLDAFRAQVEADSTLMLQTADYIDPNSPYLGSLAGAREAVRWAYSDDTEIGEVSPVIKLDNQYVVMALTGKRDKDEKTVETLRDQLEQKVRRDKKRQILLGQVKSIQAPKGNMKALADAYNQKFNPFAVFGLEYQLTRQAMGLSESGYEPAFVGKVFATQKGQASGIIGGESGILAFVVRRRTEAPQIADYGTIRMGLLSQLSYQITSQVDNWVRENAGVDDRRYRFY